MTDYIQPIQTELHYDSVMDVHIELPVYSGEVIAQGNAMLDEMIKNAEDKAVSLDYYIREFMTDD
jgi:hypothetical protein